jgi:hypothetical protein
MKELTTNVDLDEEGRAIVSFLEQKWAPLARLPELVTEIRTAALRAARGWIDQYAVSELAHELEKEREKLLKTINAPDDARYYDAYLHFLDSVSSFEKPLYQAGLNLDGQWDYGKRVKRLAWVLTESFTGLPEAKPLGYDEACGQNVHDLCEAYTPGPDRDQFQGSRVEGVLSGPFPMRVALPYVLVDREHGYEPWTTLIGAIYAHFLGLQKFRNVADLTNALGNALPYGEPAVQFALPAQMDNPFLQTLLIWMGPPPTEDAYRGAVRQREAVELPADQRNEFLHAEPALIKAQAEDLTRRSDVYNRRWSTKKDQFVEQLKAELDKEKPSNI